MRLFATLLLAIAIQAAPQNPSPMSDSTRPHPRVARYDVPGQRAPLSVGTLYLSSRFRVRPRVPLIVHFHGAPWLIEHHIHSGLPGSALVSLQIGAGSRVYADAFSGPEAFGTLLAEAAAQLSALTGRAVTWDAVTLSSFSAGYGAVRTILGQPAHYSRVDAVLLADSLHASYVGEASARATDLPVDESMLEPFVRFAGEAVGRRKWMRVTHSEVFPGTFASTTETTDVLLRRLGLSRRRVLRDGPLGMQQLSEAGRGNFHVAGFAGNSAPDHMDHLYALGRWLDR